MPRPTSVLCSRSSASKLNFFHQQCQCGGSCVQTALFHSTVSWLPIATRSRGLEEIRLHHVLLVIGGKFMAGARQAAQAGVQIRGERLRLISLLHLDHVRHVVRTRVACGKSTNENCGGGVASVRYRTASSASSSPARPTDNHRFNARRAAAV